MHCFDSHAHIGLIHDDPIEQLFAVKEAKLAGVDKIVSINGNIAGFETVYNNLKSANNVYHAVGVSPSEVLNPGTDWQEKITKAVRLERVVAIGETGLDYYRKFGNKDAQIELFVQQLELAEKCKLPVIIHNRNAGKDILEILRDKIPSRGAILHCYSEDWHYAKQALKLPVYISFAGNITFKNKNARELLETAKQMPLDKMLVESESPFMSPEPLRDQRNRPVNLPHIVNFIAELRAQEPEEIAETTYKNAAALFGVDTS